MHNEPNEPPTCVVQEITELTSKLQLAEAEIADLKSVNDRMEYRLTTLNEKLEDANNEIGRLTMVLKHRAKEIPSESWIRKHSDLFTARHH
jgi:peptidoglycan hydrolase CwlO-like protein